jgi:hypothetical protein
VSVDERVVSLAKRYAERRRTSVSRLVEDYLALLSKADEPDETPVLARLRGVLKGSSLDERAYRRHLGRAYGRPRRRRAAA